MKIFLERQSPKPIYLQIRDRISRLIKSGALQQARSLNPFHDHQKWTRLAVC